MGSLHLLSHLWLPSARAVSLHRKNLAEKGLQSYYLPENWNLELAHSHWLVFPEWENSPLNDLLTYMTSRKKIFFSLQKCSMAERWTNFLVLLNHHHRHHCHYQHHYLRHHLDLIQSLLTNTEEPLVFAFRNTLQDPSIILNFAHHWISTAEWRPAWDFTNKYDVFFIHHCPAVSFPIQPSPWKIPSPKKRLYTGWQMSDK